MRLRMGYKIIQAERERANASPPLANARRPLAPGMTWAHFMSRKERAEKRIDNIFRKRREALEGWLEVKTQHGHLDAVDIQCMEWEEEGFSRELKRAFELREACS